MVSVTDWTDRMDWAPLAAVLDEDDMGEWMWMGAQDCDETGQTVHFYKNDNSRRYLRLDAQGTVYGEDQDGCAVALPACGGATLLILLAVATGDIEPGVPIRIRVPEGARQPPTIEDLEVLAGMLAGIADDYATTRERCVLIPPV